jgi:plasmid replication initiation protein
MEAMELTTKSPKALHQRMPIKKPVEMLAIIPKKDRITILARKVYNIMIHEAQMQGGDKDVYRMRLRDLVIGLDFNSENVEVLKNHLRQMASTTIEWQSPTRGEGAQWGITAMISQAEIVLDGGESFIEWSYSTKIKNSILNPERFAKISFSYQADLKTHAGLALYEICTRYIDNFGGLTARNPWQWWRPVLTGFPEPAGEYEGAYAEWKYFNRDIVKSAVAEVNAVTNLVVTAIEHKVGRSVKDLQFKVERKSDTSMLSSAVAPVNMQDLGRAIRAGIPQDRAEKLMARFSADRFKAALDDLEDRLQATNLPVVRSPEKFLKAILDSSPDQSTLKVLEKEKTESLLEKSKRIELLERYREHQRNLSWALFNEKIEQDQKEMMIEFEMRSIASATPAIRNAFASRGITSPMVKSLFRTFLAEALFGPSWSTPNDSELLNFSLAGAPANG